MAAAAVDPAVPISLHPTHTQLRPISCGSLWQQQLWTPSCPHFPSPHPHAAASYQLGQLMAVAAAVKPQLSRFLSTLPICICVLSAVAAYEQQQLWTTSPLRSCVLSAVAAYGSSWLSTLSPTKAFFEGWWGGGWPALHNRSNEKIFLMNEKTDLII